MERTGKSLLSRLAEYIDNNSLELRYREKGSELSDNHAAILALSGKLSADLSMIRARRSRGLQVNLEHKNFLDEALVLVENTDIYKEMLESREREYVTK